MARENQGLQIALIIFVMLTIILGVTTYLFFRNYEEADIKAKDNLAKTDKAAKLAQKNDEDVTQLKKLIGVPATEKVDTIVTTIFNDDMKKYAANYPDEVHFYRPLLDKMSKTINEKSDLLVAAKNDNQILEDKLKTFESSKQPQIDEFKKAAEDAGKDLASERTKFKTDRDRLTQAEINLQANLENARKDGQAAVTKIQQTLDATIAQGIKLKTVNRTLADRQKELTAQKFEIPSGEVRWVDQRTGTAWINLGRADSLQRQVTFGVYPADITDMTTGGKKASIEVTQVLGDHLAEAHVFEDKLVDPIMPGDKIYTPVWIPGEKRHFALAGFLDPNGEGKNDVQTVRDIIAVNGGVVDCYLDDKGKRMGDMTVNTRYLVVGEAPTEKSQPAVQAGITKMLSEAERLGVQKIQLNDLLQRMGWRNRTPIVRYGRGANIKDFAAKPDPDQHRISGGNVSDVYQKRSPPIRTPTGAY